MPFGKSTRPKLDPNAAHFAAEIATASGPKVTDASMPILEALARQRYAASGFDHLVASWRHEIAHATTRVLRELVSHPERMTSNEPQGR